MDCRVVQLEIRGVVVTLLVLALIGGANALLEPNIPRLGLLSFMELCREFNHTCEEHEVITGDGYKLTLHRIKGTKRTLFGWHGIFDSSDAFLLSPNSTGSSLAQLGDDVWLGNSRGNKYSRFHVSLDPEDDKFWDFSFHEMGVYDMAACIDYVLKITGKSKLSAFGYSQGTTEFYALASTKPIYNEKVQLFISMAPIAYLTNVKPVLKYLIPLWPVIDLGLKLVGVHELFKNNSAESRFVKTLCTTDNIGYETCGGGFAGGQDKEELDPEFLKVIVGHFPTSSSSKVISHYAQVNLRKRFAQFDYGAISNLAKYGTISPPDYDLESITAAIVLLSGRNDRLSTLEDVELLRQRLKNVKEFKIMDRPEFNHGDWIWSKNIDVLVNPIIKQMLDNYA